MPGDKSRENGKLGGRPPGRKNNETLEREKVDLAVKQRIMQKADLILNAQFSIAQGQQFLYRIDTEILSSGKKVKSKPVLVTNPEEIQDFLDGEYGDGDSLNSETAYYFITTKEPVNMAIDSMFNRALGTPTRTVDLNVKDDTNKLTPEALKLAQEYDAKLNQLEDGK